MPSALRKGFLNPRNKLADDIENAAKAVLEARKSMPTLLWARERILAALLEERAALSVAAKSPLGSVRAQSADGTTDEKLVIEIEEAKSAVREAKRSRPALLPARETILAALLDYRAALQAAGAAGTTREHEQKRVLAKEIEDAKEAVREARRSNLSLLPVRERILASLLEDWQNGQNVDVTRSLLARPPDEPMSIEQLVMKFEDILGDKLSPLAKKALRHDAKILSILADPHIAVSKADAKKMHDDFLKPKVGTGTNLQIRAKGNGLVLCSVIADGRTTVYEAVRDSVMFCAKMLTSTDSPQFLIGGDARSAAAIARAEQDVSDAVHSTYICPCLVKVLEIINLDSKDSNTISGGKISKVSSIVLMPLLARTVAQVLKDGKLDLDDAFFASVALCAVAAIAGLALVKRAHCDVKPSNLMLAGKGHNLECIRLVDLGSCTLVGQVIPAYCITTIYALGEKKPVAGIQFDLHCLAATFLEMAGVNLRTVGSVEQARVEAGREPFACKLANIIFQGIDAAKDGLDVPALKAHVWSPLLAAVPAVGQALQACWPVQSQ